MHNPTKDIALLCQFYAPEQVTAANLLTQLAQDLAAAGKSVGVLCGYPHEYSKERPPRREHAAGVSIRRLSYLCLSRHRRWGRLINYFSFTFSVFLSLRFLREYKTVLVTSNPPVLPLAARLAKRRWGTRVLFLTYDLYPEIAQRMGALKEGDLICRLMRRINHAVFPDADGVIAISREMKEKIIESRPIAPERVHCIPNWYTAGTPRLRPEHPLAHLAGKRVVSFFGNMGICQDTDTILDAACLVREHPDIHFLFAGHGARAADVQRRVAREGLLNVSVCPYLTGEDFSGALALSSYGVASLLPGLCGLATPSKVYAYMSGGIPLLLLLDADMQIAGEARENGFGICFPDRSARALADAILYMPEAERVRMGAAAKSFFTMHYERHICTQKYRKLLDETDVIQEENE